MTSIRALAGERLRILFVTNHYAVKDFERDKSIMTGNWNLFFSVCTFGMFQST